MSAAPTTSEPTSRARHIVTISTYNTILLRGGDIYELRTPYAGPYYYNVLNLGPCTVYIRADRDPDVDDARSETLPPFHADNLIVVPEGTEGLRFLAGPPCAEGAGEAPTPCDDTTRKQVRASGNGNGGGAALVGSATITVRLVRG